MNVFRTIGGGPAAAAALAVCVAGCGGPAEGYDPAYRFPPRTDPVVVKLPPTDPTGPHPPGKLDDWLRDLGKLGGTVLDPKGLSAAEQAELTAALDTEFGTPATPKPESLTAASALYKTHCTQCHGATGDGRGPTSQWVYPPARDFRTGAFKFVSSANGLPTRTDLTRNIRRGVTGNAMPAFALLNEAEVAALADYVEYLSVRGKVERDALAALLGDGLDDGAAAFVTKAAARERAKWAAATAVTPTEPAAPPPTEKDAELQKRVVAGHALFAGAGGCVQCHKNYGREDVYKFDAGGVAAKVANLTAGSYRGGSDAADLFHRLRCGIPGSNMPAVALTDRQVWDLVVFLQALPTPRHLPAELRKAIYPDAQHD